ncbi:LLM class flavin-dependent oxidoreductase [Candidatus Bathyarchaeota archaeon]|nr:LLM class flavin-dependent oxidoreductase [Desulfobacterales bacterium]NIU80723.1 LLM class flavin-dependent oxidoreductase [Candidatus Bathyarchaeota archaeon]NIW15895.1 LLM class flavin-dependent oxidoreductase [Candidatus Bathyarchaeota archaeon]
MTEVKFGLESTPYPWERISELANYVERVGFDSFWMPDHTIGFGIRRWNALEAWTTLSALATQTTEVRLGTCVGDVYRHHPASLAQMVTTCDTISQGRVTLGVGIGEAMNLLPFGIPLEKPVGRTRETVSLIRKLWTEDSVDYEGKYHQFEGAFLQPKPVQKPHPPIWIAANSPMTMKMVAELGDGWVPASIFPDEYAEGLQRIRKMAEKAGRDADEVEPALFTFTVVAQSHQEARRAISLPAKIYFLTRPRIPRRLGYDVTDKYDMTFKLVMEPETTKALLEEAKQLPDEILDEAPVFFGAPEDIIEAVEDYVDAGVRHFVVNFYVRPDRLKDNLKLFAEEVIPHFSQK